MAIFLLIRNLEPQALLKAFGRVSIWSLILVLLVGFLSLLVRVGCWYFLLNKKFPFWRVFFVMNAGYLLNNVLPFRLGEVGRAVLLGGKKDSHVTPMEVLSSIVVERVIDIFLAFAFFLGSLSLINTGDVSRTISVFALFLLVLLFIILAILAKKRENVNSWLESKKPGHYKLITWAKPKVDAILKGFSVINNPALFWTSFGLLFVSWCISMLQHWIVLEQIVPLNQAWWVVFLISAGALGFALPSAPAGIGLYEAAIVGAFALLKVDYADALAYALVLHAIQFLMSSALGFIGLVKEGSSVHELYRKAVNRKDDLSQVEL